MTKEERRERMPIVSAWFDEMRETFGAESIVGIRASENGLEIDWRKNEGSGGV